MTTRSKFEQYMQNLHKGLTIDRNRYNGYEDYTVGMMYEAYQQACKENGLGFRDDTDPVKIEEQFPNAWDNPKISRD